MTIYRVFAGGSKATGPVIVGRKEKASDKPPGKVREHRRFKLDKAGTDSPIERDPTRNVCGGVRELR